MDLLDLMPQGDPETVVLLPTGSLIGLHVRGLETHVMLGIREDSDGQPVSCAVAHEMFIDTSRVQSNPRRADDEDGA